MKMINVTLQIAGFHARVRQFYLDGIPGLNPSENMCVWCDFKGCVSQMWEDVMKRIGPKKRAWPVWPLVVCALFLEIAIMIHDNKCISIQHDTSLDGCICEIMFAKACEKEQPVIKKKKMPTSKEGASTSSREGWPIGLPLPPPRPKHVLIPPPPPLPKKQYGNYNWKDARPWGKNAPIAKACVAENGLLSHFDLATCPLLSISFPWHFDACCRYWSHDIMAGGSFGPRQVTAWKPCPYMSLHWTCGMCWFVLDCSWNCDLLASTVFGANLTLPCLSGNVEVWYMLWCTAAHPRLDKLWTCDAWRFCLGSFLHIAYSGAGGMCLCPNGVIFFLRVWVVSPMLA